MDSQTGRKKIVFTVTNDLSYDQRMGRICSALSDDHEVLLVGRRRRNSKPLTEKPYAQKRIFCFFEKGKLFYLEYNFRLLCFLLFCRVHVFGPIDLDTILPHLMASKIRRKKIIWDAHELFTELQEVVTRPAVHSIWKKVEAFAVPKVDQAYTISEGYAEVYERKYGIKMQVIRNVSLKRDLENPPDSTTDRYILYQGAVNVGRGLESSVSAMKDIKSKLVICGHGDIFEDLQTLVKKEALESKVELKGYVDPSKLKTITSHAYLGLTLFSEIGLSHRLSLCNRFFDYFHAGIPQIAVAFPEYIKFNEKFEVALLVDDIRPETIASAVRKLLEDEKYYQRLRNNCLNAREEVNWQNESRKLKEIYAF